MTTTTGTFTRMDDATPEELAVVVSEANTHLSLEVADRLLATLETLKGPTLGYQVDRYEHSLQTATRAARRRPDRHGHRRAPPRRRRRHRPGQPQRAGRDDHLALRRRRDHLGRAPPRRVPGYHYWHKIGFDRNARDSYRDSPYFDAAAHFCGEWDQQAFDPDYDTLPIESFEPMVREVFSRPASGFGDD